jgi:hypothetical protein
MPLQPAADRPTTRQAAEVRDAFTVSIILDVQRCTIGVIVDSVSLVAWHPCPKAVQTLP